MGSDLETLVNVTESLDGRKAAQHRKNMSTHMFTAEDGSHRPEDVKGYPPGQCAAPKCDSIKVSLAVWLC